MKRLFIVCVLALGSLGIMAQKKSAAKPMTKVEMQQALKPLFDKLNELPDGDDAEAQARDLMVNFAKANKNDAGVMVVCNYLPQMMKEEEFEKFVNGNKFWRENDKVKSVLTIMEVKKATSEGKMFADFSAEYEGATAKLSDYVGKGNYVLVDFWASWCGPCKMEIPNLINVYNKYKEKGLVVLGVATWDEPKNTLKAIEELGIPYPQMLNAQRAGSDAYGIQGIPQIILFGPDGTILKRDLRGEAIDKTIGEYLK